MLRRLSEYIDKETFIAAVLERVRNRDAIILDSFVSNSCNLRCSHCYFLDYTPVLPSVPYERWSQIIDESILCGIKHYHFSGKEPFCDQRIYRLLSKLDALAPVNDLFYGVVSNGTHISPQECNALLRTNLSYLEISIEGMEEYNDSIRGRNHFQKVDNLIDQITDKRKINITSTISEYNIDDLLQLIRYMIKKGVSKFNIAPLMEFSKEAMMPDKETSIEKLLSFYSGCCDLISDLPDDTGEIVDIRICLSQEQAYKLFLTDNILTDEIRQFIYEGKDLVKRMGKHIVEINYPMLYIPYLSQLVITHEGYVIPCADDIHYQRLNSISLGNIMRESMNDIFQKRYDYIKEYLTSQLC